MKSSINKVFILCGGLGTRLDHEGRLKAKPMYNIKILKKFWKEIN